MTGKRLLLAIALVLLASPPLLADRPDVDIHLKRGNQGEPRTIWINLHATAVCWDTEGCPEKLDFRWMGTKGEEGERIQVEYQPGLYWDKKTKIPGALPAEDCFIFPDDKNPFEIEHGPTNGVELIFRKDNEECRKRSKIFYFYDIRCIGGKGGDCDGVAPMDPGTMIDNGG